MPTFNLDNFKSTVFNTGLARTNRFEVIITPPAALQTSTETSRLISLLAESTNFPPINVSVTSQRIFGPSYQRPKFIEFGGDSIIINFLVDTDMRVKRFFEDWIETIIEPETYLIGYQDEYASTLTIHQLDEEENTVYTIDIFEVFPRSLNIMDLNNTNQNSFHRLAVSFAYRYWSSKGPTDGKNPVIIPQSKFRENYDKFTANKKAASERNTFVIPDGTSNQPVGGNTTQTIPGA